MTSINYVVDSNFICYRSFFSLGKENLTYENKETGIIFGFVNQLTKLMFDNNSTNFSFCWDSKKSHRKLIYPEYKVKRKENKTEKEIESLKIAYKQFNTIRKEVIPYLNFNSFIKTGLESDDLIANIVKDKKYNYVIISSDQDLYQLLFRNKWNKFCVIYNFKQNYTKEMFEKEYEIEVEKWNMVKAIAGCSSDNVEGVIGVGEKTAIKYLKGELKSDSKKYLSIESSKDIIERNLKLVTLPFAEEKLEIQKREIKFSNFVDVFEKYNFKSLLKKEFLLKLKTFLNNYKSIL